MVGRILVGIAAVLLVVLPARAEPQLPKVMDVFTTAEYPVQRAAFITATPRSHYTALSVYRVDGLDALEQLLSADLPADPDEAQEVALTRMQEEGPRVRELAQSGADALELAIRYQIDRYPAIVFNRGEAVIYGLTNIEEAISIYLREARRR